MIESCSAVLLRILRPLPIPCHRSPSVGDKEGLTHFKNETSPELEGEGTGVVRTAPGLGVGMTAGVPSGAAAFSSLLQLWTAILLRVRSGAIAS